MSYPQQHHGQYGTPGHWGSVPRRGNSFTAVVAALAGLVAAGAFGYLVANLLMTVPVDVLAQEAGPFSITVAHATAALLLLLGAVLVFARQTAGAALLLIGGLLGVASVLCEPLALGAGLDSMGRYVVALLRFSSLGVTVTAIGLIGSALAFLVGVLPPTFTWLRGSRA